MVPSTRINYELSLCNWPPKKYRSDKINRWVMGLIDPKSDFEDMSIEVMYEFPKAVNNSQ